ncbi:MAG: phosphate signaling complex protein PhoU [Pirellulaceae bacterium]
MKKFDSEIAAVEKRIVEMSKVAKNMVTLAVGAVKERTRDVSQEVAELEKQINQMQTEIDQDAIRMLTVFGPVASNLRYLLVCTHITAKLERMGDQVVNVCDSLRMMTSDPATHPVLESLRRMADLVDQMVVDALQAYYRRDPKSAATTRTRDDVVDALNDQIVKELLTDEVLRDVLSGAENIADAVAQILLARQLERIADQATNICKEVIYMVRGDDVRHKKREG